MQFCPFRQLDLFSSVEIISLWPYGYCLVHGRKQSRSKSIPAVFLAPSAPASAGQGTSGGLGDRAGARQGGP